MSDPQEYRIALQRRDTEDGILFEATVAELPDVAVYAEEAVEAYQTVLDVIEGLRDRAARQGNAFPEPAVRERDYSGKFVIRMPKRLHRSLAETARDEAVSLNQYVLSILSCHRSWHQKVSAGALGYPIHEITAEEIPPMNWFAVDDLSHGEGTFTSGATNLIPNFGDERQ